MYGEFCIYGVFIPTLLGLMLVAYLLHNLLRLFLLRVDAYRYVWHPSLFNVSLYLIVLWVLFKIMRSRVT